MGVLTEDGAGRNAFRLKEGEPAFIPFPKHGLTEADAVLGDAPGS